MKRLRKERCNPYDYARKIREEYLKSEDYKRYKRSCYGELFLKALVGFLLGLLLSALFRCLVGIPPR